MAEKTETERWDEFQAEQLERERVIAESYAEAGTLPPGVVDRNPATYSPEANYAARDNIVVSGASPHNVQAAVEHLADEESRARALDAADVAQSVSREDYEQAVLSAEINSTVEHPGESQDPEAAPKAPGGTQPDEDTVEASTDAELERLEGEPTGGPDGSEPEHHQESGPDALEDERNDDTDDDDDEK